MRRLHSAVLGGCITALMLCLAAAPAHAQKALDRLQRSTEVLHEIMSAPDGGIPDVVLRHAQCVMVVPGYKRAGFGFGGAFGRGVVSCRVANAAGQGSGWSAPLFVTLGGGSFGLQIGAQEADVVMLIMSRDGETSLLHDHVSLGGDMAATAGPVGRQATAETDLRMKAKMLAYSRSRGLFGGITLKGGVIKQDRDSNQWLYHNATAEDILDGKAARPAAAHSLLVELNQRGR